jgi:hypothetical protein
MHVVEVLINFKGVIVCIINVNSNLHFLTLDRFFLFLHLTRIPVVVRVIMRVSFVFLYCCNTHIFVRVCRPGIFHITVCISIAA